MLSASVVIGPRDNRCRYWAKIVRNGISLPVPSNVTAASDVPGAYSRNGDEEIFVGDLLIDGEEKHHRHARGWDYHLVFIDSGGILRWVCPTSEDKADVKSQGLDATLLSGAGGIAACVRLAHALRAGLSVRGYRLGGR